MRFPLTLLLGGGQGEGETHWLLLKIYFPMLVLFWEVS